MRSALYYPHTEIQSKTLLKKSLLLWDRLEFIVPDKGYRPYYTDPEVSEAIELIGVQHCPTNDEKKLAHDHIEDFGTGTLPAAFYYKSQIGVQDYEIYPQKLFPETWSMLQQLQLAGNPLANYDYPLAEGAGLSIMSILADICAGETRARITDRGLAYATITNLLVDHPNNTSINSEMVVPVIMDTIDISDLTLRQLIEFRKQEEKSGGLRELRHRYVDRISTHIKSVLGAKSQRDKERIESEFREDMEDDLRNLRAELRSTTKEVLLSKELLTVGIAAVGSVAITALGAPFVLPAGFTTLGGGLITVGGILATQNKYVSSRKAVMQKHPMAFIYELEKFQ